MNNILKISSFLLCATASAHASLYYVPNDTEESLPLKWSVGVNLTWDDNITPSSGITDESVSLNAYVGVSYAVITPQTTWDLFARLGIGYYLDEPTVPRADDVNFNNNLGLNLTHRFTERLRFVSRNYLSYELEPDYSQGFATNRESGEYFNWNTDNSIGFRWTERFATYTGFSLTGLIYDDLASSDRGTWTLYNQFRYQLSPLTVLTSSYRYSETSANGIASDSSDQYILIGLEHRFSPSTIVILNTGAQIHEVDNANGNDNTSPYVELSLNSQLTSQFSARAFVRYGIEPYDNLQTVGGLPAEYDSRLTLRVGASGSYQLSPKLSLFGGTDVLNTSFEDGRTIAGGLPVADSDEFLLNIYIGASVKFTERLFGTLTYNYTTSDSDFALRDYDRNRVSIGLTAEF
jgi:hypothetical protein